MYYPSHPSAGKGSGIVYLHRLIMENHLGRYLTSEEVVHHKDENRSNNVIENLELTTNSEHIRHHHPAYLEPIACKKCGKIFQPEKYTRKFCSPECGRHKKIEWPPMEWLEERLKNTPYTTLAKELGISDNAIRKHMKGKSNG